MRWRKAFETAATIAVAVVWLVGLRPVALGGPASYIVVNGYSMSGALAPGDLVVTMAQGSYSAGDAIVYRVPSGAGRGLLVVHRIIRADAAGYTMQGDANSYQDPWRPKASDVVGRLVVTVPQLSRLLSWLANPFVLAAAWGLVALILGMSFVSDPRTPKSDPDSKPRTRRRRHLGSMIRIRARHRVLNAATGLAVGVMVGLVVVGAGATLSPAHAAGLRLRSSVLTAEIGSARAHPGRPRPVPQLGRPLLRYASRSSGGIDDARSFLR
jgi:signal peptidase I